MPKRNLHIPTYIGITLISVTLLAAACNHHPTRQATTQPAEQATVDLHTLLRPTNSAVISGIPVTTLQSSSQSLQTEALGRVDYDTRRVQTIAARISGRIEKLYVKYRYQHVHMDDKIMDIYSPELVTAQQDLLFILHNDPGNTALLDAAKTKLQLLGMDNQQLQQVIQSGKPQYKVTVYTHYTGHIHEAGNMNEATGSGQQSGELPLKEGMYVQKGQTVFQLYNTDQSWIILNLYPGSASRVKAGTPLTITPETAPDKPFKATIGGEQPAPAPGFPAKPSCPSACIRSSSKKKTGLSRSAPYRPASQPTASSRSPAD